MENQEEPEFVLFYLDWNVLSYLKNIKKFGDNPSLVFLHQFLEERRSHIIVPYSPSHLDDIKHGFAKDNSFTHSDLDFLSCFTKNLCVSIYWGAAEAKFEYRDPTEFFYTNLENDKGLYFENPTKINLVGVFENLKELGIEEILNKIPFDDSFIPEFEKLGMKLNKFKVEKSYWSFMLDFAEWMQNMINEGQDGYTKMRNLIQDLTNSKQALKGKGNPIELFDQFLPTTVWGSGLTELLQPNPKDHEQLKTFHSKLVSYYMGLDLAGFKTEKITYKNTYSNLMNDANHCFYAAHCSFFITNDEKAYQKAKAVYEYFGIPTIVKKPIEFYELFSQEGQF